jgi:hypothetical protein
MRCVTAIFLVLTAGPEAWVQATTIIEQETPPMEYKKGGGLGTMVYRPREKEKPFLEKLDKREATNGSILSDYSILGKTGKSVGWFAIVRGVSVVRDKPDESELLLEHKYFDGLTDTHIMALSFNGSGPFKARVKAKGFEIEKLVLVRIYGKVVGETDNVPMLDAEYVRVWPWKTFTFLLAYGTDRTNPKWRKECKVKLDDIYNPYPEKEYYEARLGKREE